MLLASIPATSGPLPSSLVRVKLSDLRDAMRFATADADRVYIYYDVLNNGPNQAPDVILDTTTSMINQPRTVDVDNCLAVGNLGNDTVTIFDDFLNLTTNQAPTVVLDNATSTIDKPSDLQFFNGDLYVCSQDDDTVLIFRNIAATIAGGVAVAPDVTLDNAGSGIQRPVGEQVKVGLKVSRVPIGSSSTVSIAMNPSTFTSGKKTRYASYRE